MAVKRLLSAPWKLLAIVRNFRTAARNFRRLARNLHAVAGAVLLRLFHHVVAQLLEWFSASCSYIIVVITKDLKDLLLKAMSVEKTTEGRKTYVNDAFDFAKMQAKTDPDLNLDDKALKPLYDDALKIADGTWESYHQKHDLLFKEAVKALVEMGNCSSQRHLNQKQADAIEAFISQDGGDRDMLCVDLWEAASPKIEYYWRDGTFDALEELRTREFYSSTYGTSISHSSRHL